MQKWERKKSANNGMIKKERKTVLLEMMYHSAVPSCIS